MTVGEVKKLLEYINDDVKIVVGCEGYSNYHFDKKELFDGDDSKIQLTKRDDVLVIHPRNDSVSNYR